MTKRTCEREECDNTFTPPPSKKDGLRRQKFCSMKCKTVASGREWSSKGKIPAAPFLSRIGHLLPTDPRARNGMLAKRCNIKENSIYHALQRDELDFDLCDLILCKLNAVHYWWTAPLDEFYWSVEL